MVPEEAPTLVPAYDLYVLLRTLVEKLGFLTRGRTPAWQRTLNQRGLDPLAAHVLSHHSELDDAWRSCPRADWVLEVAVRARIEPALVVRGVRDVTALANTWPLVSPEAVATLAVAVDEWQRGERSEDTLVSASGPALLELVERAPAVDAASRELREASRWKQRARIQAAADRYDETHRDAHWELAERFRRSVPADALSFALLGQRAHPYR